MKKGKYILITPNVGVEVRCDGDGEKPSLEFLQKCVGGWIEHVVSDNIPSGVDIYCNEEGKLKLLPYNDTATILYGNPHDFIVGTAVIVGHNDEGESLWLTDEQVCAVVDAVRNAS